MKRSTTPFTFNIAGRNREVFNTAEKLIESIKFPDGLSPDERTQLCEDTWQAIQNAFKGRIAIPAGDKAILLSTHGAPGSGKTHNLYPYYKHRTQDMGEDWVYVAYDEHGILESLSGWQNEMKALDQSASFEDRLHIRDRYRDASQVGRDLVFHKALTDHFNIINDVTNCGENVLGTMESARLHGFHNVVAAYFSPYEISKERVMHRARPASINEEIIGKRIGSYNLFPVITDDIIKNHEDMIVFYNPDNNTPPATALYINSTKEKKISYLDQSAILEIKRNLFIDSFHPDLDRPDYRMAATKTALTLTMF